MTTFSLQLKQEQAIKEIEYAEALTDKAHVAIWCPTPRM